MVQQIVIRDGKPGLAALGSHIDLTDMVSLITAAGKPPALSDATPLIAAKQETWTATGSATVFASATAAHQFVRYNAGVARASVDAAAPVNLAGV